MKNRHAIIVVGINQRDPGPYEALTSTIKRLAEKHIPMVFCEDSKSAPIEERIAGNEGVLKQNQRIIQQANLSPFFISTPRLPRPHIGNLINLTQTLINGFRDVAPHLTQALAINIASNEAMKSSLVLGKSIQQHHVPYHGIANELQHNIARKGRHAYLTIENERMQSMTEKISALLSTVENGSIVLVLTAINQTHRLAAHLYTTLTSESKIIPVRLFSPYLDNAGRYRIDEADAATLANDPEHIQNAYTQAPCYEVEIHEDPSNGEFQTTPFDEVVQKALDAVCPNRRRYTIPAWNETKAALIQNLGGNVLNNNNGIATIEIDSTLLLKDQRFTLGIDRKLLKLSDSIQAHLARLANDSSITVERSFAEGQFLVTFPTDRLRFVTEATTTSMQAAVSHTQQAANSRPAARGQGI